MRPGQVISHPIYSPQGALLLRKGQAVNERFLSALELWGISEVCIDDGAGLGRPEIPAQVTRTVERAVNAIAEAFQELSKGNPQVLREVSDDLGEYALRLAEEPGILLYLGFLHSRDDYTFHHCTNVGVISALMGKWCGLDKDERFALACAGSLHDVGKALIPLEILNKPGRLSPSEFEVIKKHTTYGYEALAGVLGEDSLPALVALEHHERLDRSGYPNGLEAASTHFASRIVAVADVFHAMTTNRVYRRREPGLAVLAHLREACFVSLDSAVVQTFLAHMIPLSVGRKVRLSDGRLGKVVFVPEQFPDRPVVQVGSSVIDLSANPGLSVEEELDEWAEAAG